MRDMEWGSIKSATAIGGKEKGEMTSVTRTSVTTVTPGFTVQTDRG